MTKKEWDTSTDFMSMLYHLFHARQGYRTLPRGPHTHRKFRLLLTALCTASIIYAAVQGGAMSKVLTIAPLLWIGRISYGIYLLHWPVFLWLSPARVGWSPWPLFALRMAVTIGAEKSTSGFSSSRKFMMRFAYTCTMRSISSCV